MTPDRPVIVVKLLDGDRRKALIDTGADVNMVISGILGENDLPQETNINLQLATPDFRLKPSGKVNLDVNIQGQNFSD